MLDYYYYFDGEQEQKKTEKRLVLAVDGEWVVKDKKGENAVPSP